MAKQCICEAGGKMVKARRAAERLEGDIDRAIKAVRAVADNPDNGVKHNMIGPMLEKLGQARMAAAHIASAHLMGMDVLARCGEEPPTDGEIVVLGGGGR